MSKKFGKFILAATAVTTAAAAAYYFMRKEKTVTIGHPDKGPDDFSDESVDDAERSYVELNTEGTSGDEETSPKEPVTFTSLTKQIKKTAGRVVGRTIEAVEDFFDDEEKDNAGNCGDASADDKEETSGEAGEGTSEDAAAESVSVKIEEDIVDAVKDAAKEAPAEDEEAPDPAVQIEVDTVKAVQAEDSAAEETEVFLDEEEESEETK